MGIDHIGTTNVSIRRTMSAPGVIISRLRDNSRLELNSAEWHELAGLVLAVKRYADFSEEYTESEGIT